MATKQEPVNIDSSSLLNHIPCHIYLFDLENKLIWANNNQQNSASQNVGDLIGKTPHDIVVTSEANVITQNNLEVISSLKAKNFNEFATFGNKTKYYHSHKAPFYDKDGKLYGVIGISQDITQIAVNCTQTDKPISANIANITQMLKQFGSVEWVPGAIVKECLENVKNYFDVILGVMPGSFYWFDKDNKLLGCNKQQAEVFGHKDYLDIIGKSLYDLMPENEAKAVIQNNRQIITSQSSTETIEDVSSSDGKTLKMLSTKKPIFDKKGTATGIIGVALDITELHNAQLQLKDAVKKAEQANDAKTEFLLNISHDIRTPCSGLLGFTKILREEETDADKCEKLGYIEQSAEKLLSILNQLIDYVRDDSKPVGYRQIFNLRELICGIKEVLAAKLESSKLYLKIDYPETLSNYWLGDHINLERILLNIITNAIKFTQQGGVNITVQSCETNNEHLKIIITDTGCGIAVENHEKIFEQFQRLTPSYVSDIEGMGLGLSLVKNLISKLGGTISLQSEVGVGSTFSCTLPFTPASLDYNKHAQDTNFNSTNETEASDEYKFNYLKNKKRNKVLIIEDDLISRKINRIILEKNGFNVTECASAEEAIALQEQFDLVITDIGLPKMNGFELSSNIRTKESITQKKHAFIVGLSAHLGPRYKELAKQSGMNDIITKPLTEEILASL